MDRNMKNFVIYTPDGYTQAPDMTELENCQILAFESARDKESALKSFTAEHADLFQKGFHNIECREIIL